MFSFFVPITIWSQIAYSSALQLISHSQKVHVFPVASSLLQKALKVSFLTWTNCLNSDFCIIGSSVGLEYDWSFFRKWSHVQFPDRTAFGSAAFQSWISLVAKNPRSFFTVFYFTVFLWFTCFLLIQYLYLQVLSLLLQSIL